MTHHHHQHQQKQHGIAELKPHPPAFRGLDHDGKTNLLGSCAGLFRTCDHSLVEDVLWDSALLASQQAMDNSLYNKGMFCGKNQKKMIMNYQ